MASIFTDYWRIVKPAPQKIDYQSSNTEFGNAWSNYSWYTKIMRGAGSRLTKYIQYKNMDADVFVSRALDTIAEEITPINEQTDLPFDINYQNEAGNEISENVLILLKASLRHWIDLHNLEALDYDIARTTIKYGDCFFRKTSDFKQWEYIKPENVIGIELDKKTGKILRYQVKNETLDQADSKTIDLVPAAGIIHFSLGTHVSEHAPFGESVLLPTVKAFRHLSLLEDSVIIYRIVRAPEKRVFFIDTGNMPPQRAKSYLESLKNDMKQKRIPSESGGQDSIDSMNNPMGMVEDFFFAQSAGGRGSKVETLPGGSNLGEIADLSFFQNKFLQGLRIPSSYMRGSDDSGSTINDGKVGVAYIEEQRFANYVKRLQNKLETIFDKEFKCYLKSANIKVDSKLFKLKFPDAQNFAKYRQSMIDSEMVQTFNNIKDIDYISSRFALKRYLGWSEDDIKTNETMVKQEKNIPDNGIDEGLSDIRMIYDKAWTDKKPDIIVDGALYDYTTQSRRFITQPIDKTEEIKDNSTPVESDDVESDDVEADDTNAIIPSKDKPDDTSKDTNVTAEEPVADETQPKDTNPDDTKADKK